MSQPAGNRATGRARRVLIFLAGVVAFPALAAATGLVASFFLHASVVAGLVVWGSAIAGTILLLVSRGGWRRGLAHGMIASGVVSVVAAAALILWWPSGESASSHLASIAAHSSTPIYYPGADFLGNHFDDVIFSHPPGWGSDTDSFELGDHLGLGYGSTCSFFTSGECGDKIEIDLQRGTLPFPRGFCDAPIEGPRGTVLVRERHGVAWDAFTGDLSLRVEGLARDGMVSLVTALRSAGDTAAPTESQLPPPSRTALRLITSACADAVAGPLRHGSPHSGPPPRP